MKTCQQVNSMPSRNTNEVSAAAARARECLHAARERLTAGDLLQAATSGWKAADGMAMALALSREWPYDTPGKFHEVMTQAFTLTGEDRIRLLHEKAHVLRVAAESRTQWIRKPSGRTYWDQV